MTFEEKTTKKTSVENLPSHPLNSSTFFPVFLQILRDMSGLHAARDLLLISTSNQGTQPVPPQTAALHPYHRLGLYEVKELHTVGRVRGDRERERDQEEGKSYRTCVQSCVVGGTARKHLKHGKECHMLATCALIQTHAAPLSDLSTRSGFTTKIFQLPALNTPTVFQLSPGDWLCSESQLY